MDKMMARLKKQYEEIPIPPELDRVVEKALMKRNQRNIGKYSFIGTAAALLLAIGSVNASPTLAQQLSDIPVLGPIIQIVTIVEYQHDEDRFHADLKVPAVTNMDNKTLQNALNEKYLEENKKLYEEFMKEMEEMKAQEGGNLSVSSGFNVVTDTDRLLSIQRYVVETAASGVETLKYDTIDKKNQILITLPSLFKDDRYIQIISENIKEQMLERIQNEGVTFWVEGAELGEFTEPFKEIAPDQDFYITSEGKLVISFDEYEVAPGYMGTVEFVIPTEVIQPILVSNEYIK
jgi:hypothetical protein